MADMIDVILASGLSSRGQIKTYARMAAKAVSDSAEAVQTATQAAENIEALTEQTVENNGLAQQAMEDAQTALETVNSALEDIAAAAATEIDKLLITLDQVQGVNATIANLNVTYPDETVKTVNNLIKLYTTVGNNTDGGMTQKAITDALGDMNTTIVNNYNTLNSSITTLDSKVTNIINNGGGSGSGINIHFSIDDAGKIVIIGPDGQIIPSPNLTETNLIDVLINTSGYVLKDCTGIMADYENYSFSRSQEGKSLTTPALFNKFPMYGGRMRCNVNDAGQITAFYGDSNYRDDGSNGQVMVYQPKFYYRRIINKVTEANGNTLIDNEQIILSGAEQPEFKIHPLFIDDNGNELPYVLIGAYEASAYIEALSDYDLTNSANINVAVDKLSSIAGAKPIGGGNKTFTLATARQMANNRGEGWGLITLKEASASQMLMAVEYGSFNGQQNIGMGVCELEQSLTANNAVLTGATATLGNASGTASSTTDGTSTFTDTNKLSISYRGVENPWGNMWKMLDNCKVQGNGTEYGGRPMVLGADGMYKSVGVKIPSQWKWVAAFGQPLDDYDWLFLPGKTDDIANSLYPIGDHLWCTAGLNGENLLAIGGACSTKEYNGPFYYACDKALTNSQYSYGTRILFTPTFGTSITNANVTNWTQRWEAMNNG